METVKDSRKVLLHKLHNNKYAKTPKGRYFRYRQRAKEMGRKFTLTQDEFIYLFISNCHYCGIASARGVDRIDNKIGYIKGNVLPCCRTCNFFKRAYSYEFFKDQIIKIANNLK